MASGNTFSDLNLYTWIVQQCSELGLKTPTPVQFNCIPRILAGNDCISTSQTGTGKTLAFALPILHKLSEDPFGIFALVLTPTRELAYQIAEQFRVIGKPIRLEVCLVVGGMDMMIQGKSLSEQPHVVIATPGRLADHINSCNEFSLKRVKFLVLDEADRLMEGQNFSDQLATITQELGKPSERQTLLFSATMSRSLEEFKSISTPKLFVWSSENQNTTVDKLDQRYVVTSPALKNASLVHIIQKFHERHPDRLIMVFTKTCKSCQLLSIALNNLGFKNSSLNSMLPQRRRIASLIQFKSGNVKLLFATDVASRGLDIPAVDMVINHNVPPARDYIHRVGRTARAGRGGMAVTMITPSDLKCLVDIEKEIGKKLEQKNVVEKDVLSILVQVNTAVGEADIILDENDFGEKKEIYKRKREILEEGNHSSDGDDHARGGDIAARKNKLPKTKNKNFKKKWKA